MKKENKFDFSMLFVWFVKITSAFFLLCFFKLRRIGKRYKVNFEKPVILVCNHKSVWDPVLVNFLFPTKRIYFMAAEIMFQRLKIFTWFLKVLGAFPVERKYADFGAIDQMVALLSENKIVGIFPEGKRSLEGELLRFKNGAAIAALKAGATIVPIYTNGKYHMFKRTSVMIGEPIEVEKADKALTAERIRELNDRIFSSVSELKIKVDNACK